MAKTAALTPMFRQYESLKKQHPDSILLFRMGDFYEMFYDDAREASGLVELTLTARGKGTDHVVPMCGFPHHQLDQYTARLVRARRRVAICEQVEDPRTTKGLVRREVVRVVTPGTVTDPAQLDAKSNAWLASVAVVSGRAAAAFLDVSTGEFLAWEAADGGPAGHDALADRLRAFSPVEIVHAEGLPGVDLLRRTGEATWTSRDAWNFEPRSATSLLESHFGVASLDGFGFRDRPAAVAAAGGLLQYVRDTQNCGLEHIDGLRCHEPARHLLLDPATRRNLELERSLRDGGRAGSLLDAVDSTVTAAGSRLLRQWLLAPLVDPGPIDDRLDAVSELVAGHARRAELREHLDGVLDVERLLSRIVSGTTTARDLLALRSSLERLPRAVAALDGVASSLLVATITGFDPCPDVAGRIAAAIVDDPPATLRDGGLIRDGFDPELDDLRSIRRDGRSRIAGLESAEREATGIGSLKVRFNKVFGYYIEVSKPNLHLVPDRYRRKQTIANGERFVTPDLADLEDKILHAEERIVDLEYDRFQALRAELSTHASRLKAAARAAATLDVLASLAETAARQRYCRPRVTGDSALRIAGGRHPVVEIGAERRFVPNDTTLEAGGRAVAILTGPNMGGKSTYLRQVALITLLAQAGSFVPADEADIGIVDRIFCRVGASDSLTEGHSTFMVEMTETANILHHASSRSLLLLDEIGRGTSTFDGMSIAWAVVEHIAALPGGAPRALFATHYHELTGLAVELPSVLNLRIAVREAGDDVVFLHRVEPGASDRSYGIHVARLAGIPRAVVDRAREILDNLERDEYGKDGLPRRARGRGPASRRAMAYLPFGSGDGPPPPDPVTAEILQELRRQDPDRLTPLEALERVAEWRRRLS
jgi:DNA mismatch repair protein MutS